MHSLYKIRPLEKILSEIFSARQCLSKETVVLDSQQTLAIQKANSIKITCVQGEIWLTVTGDHLDYLLQEGQSICLRNSKNIVIQALSAAKIKLRTGTNN